MKILAIDNNSEQLNALKHLELNGHLIQSVASLSEVVEFLDRSFCQVLVLGPQQVSGEPMNAFSQWRQSLTPETSPWVVVLGTPPAGTDGIDHTYSKTFNKGDAMELPGLDGIPSELDIFDYETALEICDDDPDLFKVIANIFLKDSPGRIDSLKQCMEEKNWPEVRELAHLMKGSALNLSAEPFRLASLHLENAAAAGNAHLITLWFEQLIYESGRLEQYLKRLVEDTPKNP